MVYCDAAELEEALRELRLAIKAGKQHSIDVCHDRAINMLDSTLRYSGVHGHDALVPYAWASLICSVAAFLLFLIPATRKNLITLK